MNYSSHAELGRAVKRIALRRCSRNGCARKRSTKRSSRSYLYTADLPELDLLIRPGGEHRLSNFLLYQAAYAELVMTDVFWPDFSKDDFVRAVVEYQQRERRFGGA